jgi:hypothetical protein
MATEERHIRSLPSPDGPAGGNPRERHLRRIAEHQGLRLTKRPIRNPHTLDPEIYRLNPDDDLDLSEDPGVYWGKPLSLDEVEALLTGGEI